MVAVIALRGVMFCRDLFYKWLIILMLMGWHVNVSAGNKISKKISTPVKQILSAALFAGIVFASHPVAVAEEYKFSKNEETVSANHDEVDEGDWFTVRARSPAHRLAVFYLLMDDFDSWRVMHLGYLGTDERGDALFIGSRMQILQGGKPIFRYVVSSLVAHDGLVRNNVEVDEVASFSHPQTRYYDYTILRIREVSLEEYEPLKLETFPEPDTDLEMVAYRADKSDNLLWFFNYPLEWRRCNAGNYDVERQVGFHNCHITYTPATPGSFIFTAANPALIGLHFGSAKNGFYYVSDIPQELRNYLNKGLNVNARDKLTTLWGEMR